MRIKAGTITTGDASTLELPSYWTLTDAGDGHVQAGEGGAIIAANGGFSAVTAGSIVAGNGPYWLCAAGNVLYATITNDNRVRSYDISQPGGIPVQLGQVTVGTNSGWIEKAGKYLYVSDPNALSLRALDVSAPSAPTVAATLNYDASGASGGARFGIQVRGNLLLIGGPESGANANKAYLIDISVPTAPTVVGTVAAFGSTHRGVCSFGASYFAVASRDDAKVYIIDVSVPTAPVVIASCTQTSGTTTAAVQVQGRYLYVGNYGGGTTGSLEVWDVAVPGSPVQAGTLAIGGGCEQMVIRGGNLYIGHRPSTASNVFSVVDIRNPALPRLLLSMAVGADQTPGIAVANGFVYRSSSESPGSTSGKVYAIQTTDDILRRISAIEDMLQLRPPNID